MPSAGDEERMRQQAQQLGEQADKLERDASEAADETDWAVKDPEAANGEYKGVFGWRVDHVPGWLRKAFEDRK